MIGYPFYAFDTVVYSLTKNYSKKKIITVKENSLYVINRDGVLYTESAVSEFNNKMVNDHRSYNNTINDFIKFIMNKP